MTHPTTRIDQVPISPIVAGVWRLMEWKLSAAQLQQYIEESLALGVTTFDHADIYGNYSCEAEFGKVLKEQPGLRRQMQLVSKCGIKIVSDKYPQRKVGHYDTSRNHIVQSVDQSLRNLHTDHLDLLLIHRPDPLMDPADTARAFEELEKAGKVRNFGVSNFTPMQYQMLDAYMEGKLVTNQVELSPYCLEHFHNSNMEFFLKERIRPMAWSPLGGGSLLDPQNEQGRRLKSKLEEVAGQVGADGIDKVAYAWILKHPSRPIPIVGTGKIERVKRAVDALSIALSREQWFEILIASQGHPVP
jgi:predicted oxidoreductase